MENVMMKMAVALLFLDSYTGVAADPAVIRVRLKDKGTVIRKPEGYFILMDNGSCTRSIRVESPFYETEEWNLDLKELKKKRLPIFRLPLIPNSSYPYPSGQEWIAGKAAPFEVLEAVLKGSDGIVRLIRDYRAGEEQIHIKTVGDFKPEGFWLAIQNGADDRMEEFTIWESEGNGVYELKNPLEYDYDTNTARIFMRYRTKADEGGGYRLPSAAILLKTGKGL